jgi:hypothetical protein
MLKYGLLCSHPHVTLFGLLCPGHTYLSVLICWFFSLSPAFAIWKRSYLYFQNRKNCSQCTYKTRMFISLCSNKVSDPVLIS